MVPFLQLVGAAVEYHYLWGNTWVTLRVVWQGKLMMNADSKKTPLSFAPTQNHQFGSVLTPVEFLTLSRQIMTQQAWLFVMSTIRTVNIFSRLKRN